MIRLSQIVDPSKKLAGRRGSWIARNVGAGLTNVRAGSPRPYWGLIFAFLFIASCSTFFGDSTNSTGDSFIDVDSQHIDFTSAVGYSSYQSIKFTNNATSAVTIINIVFRDNNCGDFALYSITRPSGTEVVGQGESISATVSSGSYVNINVSYTRSSCADTDYETTMYVYFTDGTTTSQATATLIPHEGEAPPVPVSCDDYVRPSGFTELTTTGQPNAGTYYLQVDRMRAYLYPQAVTGMESILGTDVDINEDLFQIPHLEISISDSTISLASIPQCEFILPSAEDHILMFGADSIFTTDTTYSGTVDENGEIEINDLDILLRADGISESSLIPDENGTFQVTITLSLITGQTEEDTILPTVTTLTSYEEGLLNLIDANGDGTYGGLEGSPITDGHVTLVGTGMLTNEDDTYIGNSSNEGFIFDEERPTMLYVQIEATLTEGGTAE